MDVQVVIDKLASLGSADAIAKYLEEKGIKGSHHSKFSATIQTTCPVANYVKRECTSVHVAIGSEQYGVKAPETTYTIYVTPDPVGDFIQRYDEGAYPNLIA